MKNSQQVYTIPTWIKRFHIALLVLIIAAPVIVYNIGQWKVRQTFKDGRNVVMSMKLISVEEYKSLNSIVDKTRKSGLQEDIEKELKELTGAKGDIILLSYNRDYLAPEELLYIDGGFVASYHYDFEENEAKWQMSYLLPIFHYER